MMHLARLDRSYHFGDRGPTISPIGLVYPYTGVTLEWGD